MRGSVPVRAFGLVVLLATVAALLIVGSASASKPLVVCASGCPYSSISAALADASDGDRIVIEAGTYAGGLEIDKSVTLAGAGPGDTTITAEVVPDGTLVGATIHPDADVAISGVTVDAQEEALSVGLLNEGSLSLTRSIVTGINHVTGAGVMNRGSMTMKASVVTDNFADIGGGIWNFSVMTIKNSLVHSNRGALGGGGITNSGTLDVQHTTIRDNSAEFVGGGILNSGSVTLKNVIFSNNAPEDCAGC